MMARRPAPQPGQYPLLGRLDSRGRRRDGVRLDYRGLSRDAWKDAYHILLTMPLAGFFGVMAAGFILLNSVFAGLYMLDPAGVSGARPGAFLDHFFFSVQTLGTLGYGVMAPRSIYANVVVTAEVFTGLFNLAIATGLLFARLSRPTARIMFSERAVISNFEGGPALMLRAANQRRNLVVEAEVGLTMVRDVTTPEGSTMRRFYDLKTVRARSPLFVLTWQIVHPIDEQSPLFGETRETLLGQRTEILVIVKGTDETFASTIHARHSYHPNDIVWGRQLADLFRYDDEGRLRIDFRRFHEIEGEDKASA